MPNVDISVDDFLSDCDKYDKQEIITALIEDGWIKPHSAIGDVDESPRSYDESEFETALDKLHGRWNMLTKEEENAIIKIGNRMP